VVGSTAAQILGMAQAEAAVRAAGGPGAGLASDARAGGGDDDDAGVVWAEQTEHKKMLARGVPDDAMAGYRPGQEPLPAEALVVFTATGKTRLTLKLAEGTLVLSTREKTQPVPLAAISKVSTQPVPGLEHYMILCLRLGPSSRSNHYFYWFPAQYDGALKYALRHY
jgi:hypothetical protein